MFSRFHLGFSFFIFQFCFTAIVWSATPVKTRVDKAISRAQFTLAVGSEVFLQTSRSELSGDSIFLGEAIEPNKNSLYQIYLNKKTQKVFYFKSEQISRPRLKEQPVLNPYEQAGGTCSGYAIYGFLYQMQLSGFVGTGLMTEKLNDEKGRTHLLVDNINRYYLTPQHQYSIKGILNKYGQDFGFKCRTYKTDDYQRLKERILQQLETAQPVMISFNLGPNMYKTPFELEVVGQKNKVLDNRIWIPRKVGERNSGGHTIVAAAAFEFDNRTYLVTIDSDWEEPRIWDMEAVLNYKTALDEVEITTCNSLL